MSTMKLYVCQNSSEREAIVPPRNTNRVGRCGLGGVKGHIKAFEKVKQGGAPCKIDAGGNSGSTSQKLNCLLPEIPINWIPIIRPPRPPLS